MWFDVVGPYPAEGVIGPGCRGRNWATSIPYQKHPSFPTQRTFNAAVLSAANDPCMDISTPPLPGHPETWQDASLVNALPLTIAWFTNYVEASTNLNAVGVPTKGWASIYARDLLFAYVRGVLRTGNPLWFVTGLTPSDATYVWQYIDGYIDGLLANAAVLDRIRGILLTDEPEGLGGILRRLPPPMQLPEIVAVTGPLATVGVPVEFTGIATAQAYDWTWVVSPAPVSITHFENRVLITFGAPGTYTLLATARNWWGSSASFSVSFPVVIPGAVAPPVVALYATSGPKDIVVHPGHLAAGTWGIQALIPDYGTLHLRVGIIGSPLVGAGGADLAVTWSGLTPAPPVIPTGPDWAIDPSLLAGASTISGTAHVENPAAPGTTIDLPFTVALTTPPPGGWLPQNWIDPRFLQAAAQRIHGRTGASGLALMINHSGCVIPAVFHSQEPPVSNFDETSEIAIPGCSVGSVDPVVHPAGDYRLEPAPGQPPLLSLHTLDDYPVQVSDRNVLLAELAYLIANGYIDDTADHFLDWAVAITDVIRSYNRLATFRSDLNTGFAVAKAFGFWLQAWGHPYLYEDPLSTDPGQPHRDDGWTLEKPNRIIGPGVDDKYVARFMAWLAIFMGSEGLFWFAQCFVGDDILESVYDPIAAEVWEFHDLRFNSFLLSNAGASTQVTLEGRVPTTTRMTMGYTVLPTQFDSEPMHFSAPHPGTPNDGMGRTQRAVIAVMLERDADYGARPAGEQIVFLINPSWQHRDVTLDFDPASYPNHGLQEWRFGPVGDPIAIPTTDPFRLRPYEVRIFRVVDTTP